MFSFGKELRAPAYGLILAGLRWVFGCQHEHTTWPINNHQTCLDCGDERQYRFTDTGIFVGRWRRPLPPDSTRPVWSFAAQANKPVPAADLARLRARNTPVEHARPGQPVLCADCGQPLDYFGACPAATSMDRATKRSPVYCQRTAYRRVIDQANQVIDRHARTCKAAS